MIDPMERVGELALEWVKWLLHVVKNLVGEWRVDEMTSNPPCPAPYFWS